MTALLFRYFGICKLKSMEPYRASLFPIVWDLQTRANLRSCSVTSDIQQQSNHHSSQNGGLKLSEISECLNFSSSIYIPDTISFHYKCRKKSNLTTHDVHRNLLLKSNLCHYCFIWRTNSLNFIMRLFDTQHYDFLSFETCNRSLTIDGEYIKKSNCVLHARQQLSP